MATGVYFGAPRSLLLQPGAFSLVDSSALNLASPFSFNSVCVLGAGLGGTPMTPYLFNDPIQAQRLFGANTPIAEAVRFAFEGGVNGGAAAVVAVRCDNAGQAYGSLPAANGGAELFATFDDYGAYGNTFSVNFLPGSVEGTMAVITGTRLDGTAYSQKIDNQTSFSALIERINQESPVTVQIVSGGNRASQTVTLATSQVDGRATLTSGQGVTISNTVYAYQYPQTMVVNSTDSLVTSFNSVITWAVTAANDTTNTFTTASSHTLVSGDLVRFAGTAGGLTAGATYLVRTVANSTSLTVAPLLAVPVAAVVNALNASTNTFTVNGNSLVDGDAVRFEGTTLPTGIVAGRHYFVRDQSGDTFKVAATPAGTAIAATGTIQGLSVIKVADATPATLTTAVSNATVTLLPGLSVISAGTPTELNGVRQAAKVVEAFTLTVTGAVVTASAYSSDSARITLQGADTWGHLLGRSLPGSIFTIATGAYTGTYQILHHEWDGLSTDKVRIVRKLSGDRVIAPGAVTAALDYYPVVQFPRLQPATVALETRLPANGLLATGGQYLTLVVGEKSAYYATQPGDTIELVGQELARLVNEDDSFTVVASAAYNASTYTSTITLVAKTPGVIPNSYRVSLLVNVQTTLLVAAGGATLSGGVEPIAPRNAQGVTSGAIVLGNGFDSVPTYQRWLDALEAIKYLPVRWLVPAGTDNLGVQIAFADHCTLMSSTAKRRERMCVLGHGLGWTNAQIRDRAEIFQNERVIFVSPGRVTSDPITGNAKLYPAYYTAALIAGALAAEGNGISDPITHTYIRNTIRLEKTYQPGSTELDQMISSGVLTIEPDPSLTRVSRGYRITRAITTYRVTVSSALKSKAFESISVVNQSDYIAAVIREMQESLFIGQALFSDTLENIRLAVNTELARRTRERIIYGFDPGFTQATRNRDSANAVDVAYKIYPVPALEFVLNTQLLLPIPTA